MALKYANDYSQDAATHGQLWSYGGRDNNTLLAMIYALLQAWQGNDTEYGIDQQNKYIDMLLNQQEKKEDRQYSEEWRDNERAYNSAQAQLARLMATGMSRDSAMQLLGAGGAGSGGSSAAPVTSTLPSGLGSSAIDYANMKINDRNSWANIVFGSIQSAASLVGLGFSANTAVKQAQNIEAQTSIMTNQMNADGSAGVVLSTVQNLAAAGHAPTKDDTSSPSALRKWLGSLGDVGSALAPQVASAIESIDTNGNNNPFFYRSLQSAFRDYHDTQNVPRMNDADYDNIVADTALKQVNMDGIRANAEKARAGAQLDLQEFENKKAEYNNIVLEGEEIEARIKLLATQNENVQAQTHLVSSQAESQDLANTETNARQTAYSLSAGSLTAYYQYQIAADIARWRAMSSEQAIKSITNACLADVHYAEALSTFNALTQTSLNNWANDCPDQFHAAVAWNEGHMGDYIKGVVDVLQTSQPSVTSNPVGYLKSMFDVQDGSLVAPVNTRNKRISDILSLSILDIK